MPDPIRVDIFYSLPKTVRTRVDSLPFKRIPRQLKGSIDLEGVFYRFIPLWSGATADDLKAFIVAYLDEADKTSGGYF